MKICSKLFSNFRAFWAEIHTQFHAYVQNLRSDNAKEYLSEKFQSFMLQNGILHRTSCVDTYSQNGVAERKNRHLLETAWALLFLLNWVTRFQTLFPHKSLFPIEPRVFGCTCFVRDVHP